MKELRIIYMGTPDFAVGPLVNIIKNGYNVVGVITQPDKKRGRGKSLSFSPIKKIAIEKGITNILQPERIKRKEEVEKINALRPDLLITCAYGQILSQKVLDIPTYGCINIHASLLPKYRGASPIHAALLNGDKVSGVTTMMTDIGMDTGDILLKKEVNITDDMDLEMLYDTLAIAGSELIVETLNALISGNINKEKQEESKASHCKMLEKEDGIIDFSKSSFDIFNQIRALTIWPGCYTTYEGKRLKVTKAHYTKIDSNKVPGSIIDIDQEKICVACKSGTLEIFEIQFDNKARILVSKCYHNLNKKAILGL